MPKNDRDLFTLPATFFMPRFWHTPAHPKKLSDHVKEEGRGGQTDGFFCCFWLCRIDFHLPKNWANLNPPPNLYLNHLKPKASSQMNTKKLVKCGVYLCHIDGFCQSISEEGILMNNIYPKYEHILWNMILKSEVLWRLSLLLTWSSERNFRRLSWHSGLVLFC